MYFNVSQLVREHSGSVRFYALDEAHILEDGTAPAMVRGDVRLLKTDRGVWVSAELDTDADCLCCRCLTQYRQPVHLVIEEEYFPTPAGETLNTGTENQPEDFYIDDKHTLDLSEAVRQYVELGVPMKPLCKTDCAGLCPTCGVNRNDETCSCEQSGLDPRWGPLLDLSLANQRENYGVN